MTAPTVGLAESAVFVLPAAQRHSHSRTKRIGGGATDRVRPARKPQYVLPTRGQLTSGFGARWGTMHNGIDIANSVGTPIVSVADGIVIEAGPASGFGLWVRIRHDDATVTVYGHMYEYTVRVGQRIRAGQQIATIGANGESTGPHLHFEVWRGGNKVDPLAWLQPTGCTSAELTVTPWPCYECPHRRAMKVIRQ